jgi:chorismate mutase-like protein
MDTAVADRLKAVRDQIDAIDEQVHRLLIERSRVIDELIRMKGVSKPGGAFRPDREADMMRRLVMRHEGHLPLATVEHIWREVITAFTAMQAPFGVLVGPSPDTLAMRDLVRFYFGFSVPVTACASNEAAIARVAEAGNDVAVIAASSPEHWWERLTPPEAPKIFARLPFIELPVRPADVPAYVVGPPLKEPPLADVLVFAASATDRLQTALAEQGGSLIQVADGEAILELPVAAEAERLEALASARLLGSFSQPIRYLADRSA